MKEGAWELVDEFYKFKDGMPKYVDYTNDMENLKDGIWDNASGVEQLKQRCVMLKEGICDNYSDIEQLREFMDDYSKINNENITNNLERIRQLESEMNKMHNCHEREKTEMKRSIEQLTTKMEGLIKYIEISNKKPEVSFEDYNIM